MMAELGKDRADVIVLPSPKLDGYDHAVRAIRAELVERYKHLGLWLFLPDGDIAGDLTWLEEELAQQQVPLFCCPARPEVEAWLLAGHREKLSIPWKDVCTHRHLKEEVFEPFLKMHGDDRSAGGGREQLTRETLGNYRGLLSVCPELNRLQERLRGFLASGEIRAD
jgi:hypothetical protein